ncbi:tetratricopeptide repeat protein [Leeuwenhoekiella polynyae]|uniref:Histidine kinase/DNA gyrase B/HSP90-like ATPase n=1 Tax=Leeuwenhoekiella polynyae TaxID=1550906 RepID=A0A4Q0P1R0_9FLAO|nr:tetratricopeptide repeat protein [Leeuwenhoekiella polynyae]RXG20028.1 histidine kinase/DNA gyrase B/HSP90-like ATPase [Leeuwenhoekiella polynyae]
MKHCYCWAFAFLLSVYALSAQEIQKIDSINAILVQNSSLKTDSLLVIFENNLKAAQKIDYKKGIGEAYKNLATIYGYEANGEKRVAYNLKAIRIFEENDLKPQAANLYGEMGYGMKRDNMEKAQYYMNKGLKMAEEGNYKEVLDRTYNNYGVLKEMQGQLDSALYFYKKGLAIVEERKYTEGLPYSYSNLAGAYGQMGNFDLARDYFYKAKVIREEINDRKGIAENFTQIGEVYLIEGKPAEAVPFFEKSLLIARKEDYRFLMQYTYQQLSETFKQMQQTDSALYYFEKYAVFKDSINSLETTKQIAALEVEFETEQKENEILRQRTQLAEKDLEVRRKNAYIFGSLGLSIILGLLGYLIYSRQKQKNRQLQKEKELQVALAKIETQNRLEEQRLRISRDLHDNIGSQLTFIIISLDNLNYMLKDTGQEVKERIAAISAFTSVTINELRDTVWAMNKEVITVKDLQMRISNFIDQAQSSRRDVDFQFKYKEKHLQKLEFSAVGGINVYRIIQEAVNNALKYAEAQTICVKMEISDSKYKIVILDDGRGFDINGGKSGHGISNMQKRANDIDADFKISTSVNKGTTISIQSKA